MKPVIPLLLSSVFLGCSVLTQTPELPHFDGTTSLNDSLKKKGFEAAYEATRSDGCSEIDRVVVAGFPVPTRQFESAGDEPQVVAVPQQTLIMTERWVLHGCGRSYPFSVNVSGDSKGKSVVDVQEIS